MSGGNIKVSKWWLSVVVVPFLFYAVPAYISYRDHITTQQAVLFDKIDVIEAVVIDIRKIVERMQTQEVTIARHDIRLDNIERQLYNEKARKAQSQ
jgi:hypothetical protein